jgi:soluble lytic murein transglycosylase-like protein
MVGSPSTRYEAVKSATWTALAVGILLSGALSHPAFGSSEAEYEKSIARLRPIEVVSGPQVKQARRAESGRALEVSGIIQGIFASGDERMILLQLVDETTVEIECDGSPEEAHPRARVRCLVEPAEPHPTARLRLVDITWDKTPIELLREAARAALKFPPTDPKEIARSAAELRRSHPMPGQAGDPSIVCKLAIAHLNPRLGPREVDNIADSIIKYSAKYSLDPYLVVAVIAAESRFNPKARSYKGAMGLGQLMPATAAAHNVDAYDPIANLHVAVRILRRNLDKYHNDWNKALAAYNAGVGAVDRHKGVPPYRETREYLWRIYEYWCWLKGTTPDPRPR